MKNETSFKEMAKIFKAVAEFEDAVAEYKRCDMAYNEASSKFDGRPATLEASAMLNTYDERKAAEKKYRAAGRKVILALDLDYNYYDERKIVEDFNKGVWKMDAVLYQVQRQSVRLAGCIKY